MNRSVHTSRYQSQFTHWENFISFKKTCCVTAYMYFTARVLFKPMLNGTTWFIIRQRHWLALSVIRPPVWKRCRSGDSSSYSQHVVCVTHRGVLCVWQYSDHQITQKYGQLFSLIYNWWMQSVEKLCLCAAGASVMKLTQGDVSMDGTEHILLADADGLTYMPGVLLMKVKLSRWGGTKWNRDTSSPHEKLAAIRSLCETHVAALKPWWTEPASQTPPVGWTSVLSLNPPAWRCGDANKMFWKVIVITL